MKLPLVSVVMPTLNSALYLREAIHSLIQQTYRRFELIIVDGGSNDATIQLAEMYMGDGDLRIIRLEPDLGIAKALNVGLATAAGEFIARMDADDLAYPHRLEGQVSFLIRNPAIDLVGASIDNFGEYSGPSRRPGTHSDIEDSYLTSNPFYHPTIMIRRTLVDAGIYRYNEGQRCDEDYELWGRLIPLVQCANIGRSLLRYRLHQSNGHWDPRKYEAKKLALRGFCGAYGITDEEFVAALADFQCAGLLTYGQYSTLRRYAEHKPQKRVPKLGWIHEAIVRECSYAKFSRWLCEAQQKVILPEKDDEV